jgi:hypothetical protein
MLRRLQVAAANQSTFGHGFAVRRFFNGAEGQV